MTLVRRSDGRVRFLVRENLADGDEEIVEYGDEDDLAILCTDQYTISDGIDESDEIDDQRRAEYSAQREHVDTESGGPLIRSALVRTYTDNETTLERNKHQPVACVRHDRHSQVLCPLVASGHEDTKDAREQQRHNPT